MNYLLYDFMQVAGGAERVTLTLAESLSDFETVVSRCYEQAKPLLETSSVEILQLSGGWSVFLPRILESIWCFRFRSHFLRNAEIAIYSGFYSPLAVNNQKTGRKIYYCHTIPRFAYDLYDESKKRFPFFLRPFFYFFVIWFRNFYESAIHQMDQVLVNSDNVKNRLKKYTGIDSVVVYPPVATSKFECLGDSGYYLSTARLAYGKRVDVIVRAFLAMPEISLVILSDGSERVMLEKIANNAENIKFVGWQSDEEIRQWIGKSRAVIYIPVDEDFGMSPVEAMAAGKPVIGVAEGGLLETIQEEQTGILLKTPLSPEKLVDVVRRIESGEYTFSSQACAERAAKFSEESFLEKIKKIISKHREE